jgi:flagellar biosynthesis chaperone FliJ
LLEKQARIKAVERLESRLKGLREKIKKASTNQELVFLDYFEQFTKLLLIKQLKIRNKLESELTETEKKERQILDDIAVNWFYKAV